MKTKLVRGLSGLATLSVLTILVFVGTAGVRDGHAAAKKGSSTAVATVDGKTITREELEKEAGTNTLQERQALYNKEVQILTGMIESRLLEQEAQKKGMSVDALVEKEITGKVAPVTDAEIQAWYDANKARVRNQPLNDQLKGQIRTFLGQQRQVEARNAYLDPLKAKSDMRILIDPPRVDVTTGNHPVKGPSKAPVTIVEFTDFQCPFCSRVGPTLEQIEDTYGKNVNIVFRDFPLAFHKDAPKAHEAALCAREQGKFWEYHDKLFANQRALKVDNLKSYAEELELDTAKFSACLESGKMQSVVAENMEAGKQYGVSGTPAFFINGRYLSGAQPFEAFAEIINDELQRKGVKIPSEKSGS